MILHFMSHENFVLKSYLLKTVEFEGDKTAINMQQIIIDIFNEFIIDIKQQISKNQIYLTTDNARNNIKLGSLLGCKRLYCMAHFMHNVINQLFCNSEFKKSYYTVRELVKFFKNSQKRSDLLYETFADLQKNKEINEND